jgi:hypothetical protein
VRVSFDGGRLNARGVAVALFDYAFHARALLGVEPIILHDASAPPEPAHVERFARAFPTHAYRTDDEMQRILAREKIDIAYLLATRRKDNRIAQSCRTAIHEVFGFFQPRGDAYAYVSDWLARSMTGDRYPAVPHIVDPPAPRRSLRAEIGVPSDAFVVGRHGAADQFNIPFVPRAIEAALARRKNLWLLLLNTDRVSDHERIVHLPATSDRQRIADFIGSCDLGLNARRVGETFGLAIAEFLAADKPALVWEGGRDRNHLELVDDPMFRYRDGGDLTRKLVEFEPSGGNGAWRSRVAAFAPERVMPAFARTFLDAGPRQFPSRPPGFAARRWTRERLRRWREARWLAS